MKKKISWLPDLSEWKNKPVLFTIIAVVLGILFLISGSFTGKGTIEKEDDGFTAISYTETLEQRIEELCKSVAGVTEATVLLTLENSKESIYAGNSAVQITEASSSQTFDYIFLESSDGEEPVLLTEIYPTVRGVAVVCTNGDNSATQYIITELLSASLGISTNRICVAGR